jgi:hypothetical protein
VTPFSPEWKLDLFRRLFTTRNDVFAFRTQIRGKPGYVPMWEQLTDRVLVRHMRGEIMIGSYTPMRDGTTPWVAADLDGKEADAFEDAKELAHLLDECGVTPLCNTSQSGRGVHVRVIFDRPVEAWFARRFMLAFVDEAGLLNVRDGGSFDRCFPAADRLRDNPKAIGNQIAAPLHMQRVQEKCGTMLLDREFYRIPLGDATWDYLDLYEPVTKPQMLRAVSEIDYAEEFLMEEAPGEPKETPQYEDEYDRGDHGEGGGGSRERKGTAEDVLRECELFSYARENPVLPYELWFAIAANLKQFGEEGRHAFHEVSALDQTKDYRGQPRYDVQETNRKFDDALENVTIYTCSRIADNVWRCPELGDDGQCNKFRNRRGRGPKAPANIGYFF